MKELFRHTIKRCCDGRRERKSGGKQLFRTFRVTHATMIETPRERVEGDGKEEGWDLDGDVKTRKYGHLAQRPLRVEGLGVAVSL